MREKIVRINGWFSAILFGLTSILGLILTFAEGFEVYKFITFSAFSSMAITGWYARKYRLDGFKINKASKLIALTSLLMVVFFIAIMPIMLVTLFGVNKSLGAIYTLELLFIPAGVSSIAILSPKGKIPK